MSAYARRAIAERQRQYQIKLLLTGNNYTLIQMNSAEFVDYIISVKMKEGKSRAQVIDWLDELLKKHNSASAQWERVKGVLKTGSGFYPLFDDMVALGVLALEMQRQGNVFGKFRIKIYGGSPAIIINSYPGFQTHLAGTRYLASNPKLFTIGVGRLEANNAMKGGFVITLIISVTFHFVDQLLNDQKTWHDLVAGIAVDMIVVGAAIAASNLLIALGGTLVSATAVVPLIIVVGVGFSFTWFFSDTKPYVDYLARELRRSENNIKLGIVQVRNQIEMIEQEYQDDSIYFMKRILGVPDLHLNKRSY